MNLRAVKWCAWFLALALSPTWAAAWEFEFHPPLTGSDATTPAAMRDLAERVLPVYEEKNTDLYLENLAALQLVAGNYTAAHDTRQSLGERRRSAGAGRRGERELLYDIYARARAIEAEDRIHFSQAFKRAFREVVPRLGDRDAQSLTERFETPLPVFDEALQKAFDRYRARGSITFPEAVDLVWTYLSFDAHRSFRPLVDALDAEEERRRYTEENLVIKTRYGAEIHVLVVRPKSVSTPLPALLEFTIDLSGNDARASASHGYAGIVAYTRGKKGRSRNRVVPFEHDGEDAREVIGWIARQPWSDGRVGMVGEGYSGFSAWAAAGRKPPALKAIATSSAVAPGIDFPMTGSVFRNSAYRWAQTHTRALEEDVGDDAYWLAQSQAWYRSGKPYRDLDRLFGKPNRIFRRWLNHPSYDRYWQKMIPFRKQFARIDIPVLTTAGYYGGDAGALYYYTEHRRYRPQADHTLLLGPQGDAARESGPAPVVRDDALDPVARVDLRELRYQWFDHVLKGGARPPILKDRVNYQVMGANQWRHAPSIEAMAERSLRFFLAPGGSPDARHLLREKSSKGVILHPPVKLADRGDASTPPPIRIAGRQLSARNALTFVSEPLGQATEFAGQLSGRLDFAPNKMDLDLNVALYELLPGGSYVLLFDPYEFRASYARDRVHRRLLGAGMRQQLEFTAGRIASRRLQAGSRVVLVLGVNQRPDREINLGSGKDVSEESIADAGGPLKIRWYGGSYIDLPIRK